MSNQDKQYSKGDASAPQNAPQDIPPDAPPSYDESNAHQSYSQQGYSADSNSAPGYDGPSEYPEEKKQENYPRPSNQPPQQYDPMNDPNVYKVPPQLVNITQANPQHLNPSYPQYVQRDQQRWAQGDVPKQYKHGAPLNPGKTNPNLKTGGGAFPGRSGASYNNAANQ